MAFDSPPMGPSTRIVAIEVGGRSQLRLKHGVGLATPLSMVNEYRPPLRIAQGVVPEVMHSVQLTGLAKRARRARSARHRPKAESSY